MSHWYTDEFEQAHKNMKAAQIEHERLVSLAAAEPDDDKQNAILNQATEQSVLMVNIASTLVRLGNEGRVFKPGMSSDQDLIIG